MHVILAKHFGMESGAYRNCRKSTVCGPNYNFRVLFLSPRHHGRWCGLVVRGAVMKTLSSLKTTRCESPSYQPLVCLVMATNPETNFILLSTGASRWGPYFTYSFSNFRFHVIIIFPTGVPNDLFTDTAAILNNLISQYIMGCPGGKNNWSETTRSLDFSDSRLRDNFSTYITKLKTVWYVIVLNLSGISAFI